MRPVVSKSSPTKQRDPSEEIGGAPQLFADGESLRQAIVDARRDGKKVGLVPTMGALHEGHLTLIDAARRECDLTVATIFVNPTQFGPQEDFRKYPRDLDRDSQLLGARGCDLIFAPSEGAMYAPNHTTFVDVGPLGTVLEGEFRPTHFRGVATIVLKLFQLAPADRAYFGRKDYQQTIVVTRMVADLNVPIEIRVCPTIRESDGLAMSSRNAYLSPDERLRAVSLSRALKLAERLISQGERNTDTIRRQMQRDIAAAGGVNVQYIAFVADGTLTPVATVDGPTTIALAATVGKTRLIDNLLVNA